MSRREYVELTEWRRGRNFIRLNDLVRVTPSRRGKHDGGEARVLVMLADPGDSKPSIIHVLREGRHEYYRPERIERRQQTRNGEAREVRV